MPEHLLMFKKQLASWQSYYFFTDNRQTAHKEISEKLLGKPGQPNKFSRCFVIAHPGVQSFILDKTDRLAVAVMVVDHVHSERIEVE